MTESMLESRPPAPPLLQPRPVTTQPRRPLIARAPRRLCLLLALALAAPAVADRPVINIEGGTFKAYPVAIAPAMGEATSGKAVLDVLSADFSRSGIMAPIDPKSF